MPARIDTHLHMVPPFYGEWLDRHGLTAGGLPIPEWSVESALELMERAGIATGVLSVSTPGAYLAGVHGPESAEAREMARAVNTFAADVVRAAPDRFGFFATLCFPDVEGSLAEIDHAFDHLGADGVILLANVDGVYLGDEAWAPVIEALDRRKAVVFVHPSYLPCDPIPGIPPFVADFLLDTTRAGVNICRSGWFERFPNVRFILSHAGGFIPYAAERIALAAAPPGPVEGPRIEVGRELLRRFYFDTALSSSPYALPSLLAFADPGRIVFGSDWPYATANSARYFAGLLDQFEMSEDQRRAIDRGNALRLFPRLGDR